MTIRFAIIAALVAVVLVIVAVMTFQLQPWQFGQRPSKWQPLVRENQQPVGGAAEKALRKAAVAPIGMVSLNEPNEFADFAFLPDSNRVATTSTDSKLRIWEVCSGKEQMWTPLSFALTNLTVSPDGSLLVTWENWWRKPIAFWNHKGKPLPNPIPMRIGLPQAIAVAFSPDARQFAVGDEGGTVTIHDTQSWQLLHRLVQNHTVTCLDFTTDSSFLAVGNARGIIDIWDANTGKRIRTLDKFREPVAALSWSLNGKQLLATCNRRFPSTSRFEVDNDTEIARWDKASGTVCHSPDGTQFLIGGRPRQVGLKLPFELFDAQTNQLLGPLEGSEGATIGAFSPNGRIIGAVNGPSVLFWDSKTRKHLKNAKDFEEMDPR